MKLIDMIQRQNDISQMLKNPNRMYNQLMQNNPEFRGFVERNKGKTNEELAKEYGIDMNILSKYLR